MLARWGLVPAWAKDLKFGSRCINARIERLVSAQAYRAAFRNRRCLVPVSGFFEWSGPTGHRKKWRICPQDQPFFGLAGLWERWFDPGSGEPVDTYTIVTTAANGTLAGLHDRMPVIVTPDRYASWLDPNCMQMELFVPVTEAGLRIEPA